jgi:hypothetical protein
MTGSLLDFLNARLNELEQEARAGTIHTRNCATWKRLYENGPSATHYRCDCLVDNWLILDIASKRRLIDYVFEFAAALDGEHGCSHTAEQIKAGQCYSVSRGGDLDGLCLLALPFATHPDYQQEWKI